MWMCVMFDWLHLIWDVMWMCVIFGWLYLIWNVMWLYVTFGWIDYISSEMWCDYMLCLEHASWTKCASKTKCGHCSCILKCASQNAHCISTHKNTLHLKVHIALHLKVHISSKTRAPLHYKSKCTLASNVLCLVRLIASHLKCDVIGFGYE